MRGVYKRGNNKIKNCMCIYTEGRELAYTRGELNTGFYNISMSLYVLNDIDDLAIFLGHLKVLQTS